MLPAVGALRRHICSLSSHCILTAACVLPQVAGIAPFNFPAMIPLWMLPIAVSTGNAFILKPSEKVPSASMKIIKLATQAGVPAGIISILHGGVAAVNFLCTHRDIKAVSFVGSGHVGRIVYDVRYALPLSPSHTVGLLMPLMPLMPLIAFLR